MRTPIYPYHEIHSKKFIDFFGWDLPLQYTSIIEEHRAVRTAVGLFDVSHMGKTVLTCAPSELSSLTISTLPTKVGFCKYTHVVDSKGKIVDDVILTCLEIDHYLCVGNAAQTSRLSKWFESRLGLKTVTDVTPRLVCLAIQGPKSLKALQSILHTSIVDLRPFRGTAADLVEGVVGSPVENQGWDSGGQILGLVGAGGDVYVTRTGYTGESGFEVLATSNAGLMIWRALLKARDGFSVIPVGLGARDTLRLEKGYLLSGQDFDGRQTPLEAGYEWLIDWDHEFVGRDALLQLKERGDYARLMGVKVLDGAIPRRGSGVYRKGELAGVLTSATFSPTLRTGIGLGYLQMEAAEAREEVEVDIRHRRHPAEVVKTPFVKKKPSKP